MSVCLRFITGLLVLALLVGAGGSVASAAPAQPPAPIASAPVPPVDPQIAARVEAITPALKAAVMFNPGGTVGLNEQPLSSLTLGEQQALKHLVADINAGVLGIAVVRPDNVVSLYGNAKALEHMPTSVSRGKGNEQVDNAVWTSWSGVHIWVDQWWTGQLKELNGNVITAFIGLLGVFMCSTGVMCAATFILVGLVWTIIWQFLRPYWPDSFTIHAPWWGWAKVQIWKPGYFYNGWQFQTGVWT